MLNIIPQVLDLTYLVGLTLPLVDISPHPNIYSNTEKSGASLT